MSEQIINQIAEKTTNFIEKHQSLMINTLFCTGLIIALIEVIFYGN